MSLIFPLYIGPPLSSSQCEKYQKISKGSSIAIQRYLGNQNLPIAKESSLMSGAAKESCRQEVVPSSLRIVSEKSVRNRAAWLRPTASIRKSAQVRSSLRKRAHLYVGIYRHDDETLGSRLAPLRSFIAFQRFRDPCSEAGLWTILPNLCGRAFVGKWRDDVTMIERLAYIRISDRTNAR